MERLGPVVDDVRALLGNQVRDGHSVVFGHGLSRVDSEPCDGVREKVVHETGRLMPGGVNSENHTLWRIVNATPEGGSLWEQ